MNGYDAQIYEYCKEKAIELNTIMTIRGDNFVIKQQNDTILGYFNCITSVQAFLHGYEWGIL